MKQVALFVVVAVDDSCSAWAPLSSVSDAAEGSQRRAGGATRCFGQTLVEIGESVKGLRRAAGHGNPRQSS